MWTLVYQDTNEKSYVHAGPTAVNKLWGVIFQQKGAADTHA